MSEGKDNNKKNSWQSTNVRWKHKIWAAKSAEAPYKTLTFGKVICLIFKNISALRIFFILCVLKENSTCAAASWSALSVSGMLCAAVVQGCHGNCPLYFLGGPRGFLGCIFYAWNVTPRDQGGEVGGGKKCKRSSWSQSKLSVKLLRDRFFDRLHNEIIRYPN